MWQIAVAGAAGRMGQTLATLLRDSEEMQLSAALESEGNPSCGERLDGDVVITDDIAVLSFDAMISFSMPQASVLHAQHCARLERPLIIGTTGFDAPQLQSIKDAASRCAICMSPNFSIGVNLCYQLVELAAKALRDHADIEIIEAHHRDKRDSPSGTALRLGETVAHALGRELSSCAIYGRQGQTTASRDSQTIGFSTIRGGDIVGDHTTLFACAGERIEINHRASSRAAFAAGALSAAKWLLEPRQAPGLYDMSDVLAGVIDSV